MAYEKYLIEKLCFQKVITCTLVYDNNSIFQVFVILFIFCSVTLPCHIYLPTYIPTHYLTYPLTHPSTHIPTYPSIHPCLSACQILYSLKKVPFFGGFFFPCCSIIITLLNHITSRYYFLYTGLVPIDRTELQLVFTFTSACVQSGCSVPVSPHKCKQNNSSRKLWH